MRGSGIIAGRERFLLLRSNSQSNYLACAVTAFCEALASRQALVVHVEDS